MITYVEENTCDLRFFPAWSGAKDVIQRINELDNATECFDFLEMLINDCKPEGYITDTWINDFLWFDAWDILEEDGYIKKDEEESDDNDD